ncbi:hypothetical protein EAO70_36440 [Streptomyces sp. adm13(2018)]|uniref:hypothetical protein n=1 Tax=Streptomyces sp. adm13(2018) TaxID=2479007 RepID=UPI0011CD5EE2|nr:hypothetical protein [Streptomyces sp. adm13(2018)]TXS07011.1 hypothetical protein EAO70_36440 [Streptomyces sp. adm13(2018)]
MTDQPVFDYRDSDGARLAVDAVNASTYYGNEPVVALLTEHRDGDDLPVVYVPLDRVEEVIAGIRDAARQASGQQSDTAETVVAYRNTERPGVLLCREHGEGWMGLTPLTSDDLPDGGICTWGREYGHECGRDVLIPVARSASGVDTQQAVDEARPPREQWRVEGYDADEWNPVSRSFTTSQDAHARKRVSQRYPDMPTRVVRETTTWTVEEDETR